MAGDAAAAPQRGIFDCDEAHRTPVQADYEALFREGMVVLDTNVLLNLYRSNEQTRLDTLAVLKKLQDRLWIPYQVLGEFWRNREQNSIRHHHRSKAKEAQGALEKVPRSARDALERWVASVHLKSNAEVADQIEHLLGDIVTAVERAKSLIETQAETDSLRGTAETDTDPVLMELAPLLEGRIGDPLLPETHAKAVQEAQRRADAEIPPGYEDFKNKPSEQAAGDYLLWVQLLHQAARVGRDVLLVTGDVKKDWWTPQNGDVPARPRMELVAEMRQRAGVSLFMLSPGDLLYWAERILDLVVNETSVSDLNQLRTAGDTNEASASNWDGNSLRAFLGELATRYQVQARVIFAAASNGGFVDRATVYDVAGYPADRQLKGFTRPVSTITRELEEAGVITGDEPFLLQTVYGSESEPSLASGFRIPDETVAPICEAFEGTSLWPVVRRADIQAGKQKAVRLAVAMLPANPAEWTMESMTKAAELGSAAVSTANHDIPTEQILRELEALTPVWVSREA